MTARRSSLPTARRPRDSLTEYVPSSVPGGRAPHLWMNSGRGSGDSLFDRLGVGFTLLRLGAERTDASSLVEAARMRGVPLKVLDVPDSEARDLYGCDLCLIRPDQHVAWRGSAPGGCGQDRRAGGRQRLCNERPITLSPAGEGKRSQLASASAAFSARLRALESSSFLRSRIDFGVTSTSSSSSI